MDKRSALILSVMVLVVLGVILFLNSLGPNHNWEETYATEGDSSKEPYGLSIFKSMLEDQFQDQFNSVEGETLTLDSTLENALYLYVDEYAFYDSTEIVDLLHFVERGNHAFIAGKNISHLLLDTFLYSYPDTTYFFNQINIDTVYLSDYSSDIVTLSSPFYTDSIPLAIRKVNDTSTASWTHIVSEYVKDEYDFVTLSHSDSLINGITFYVGSGSFTFFTTPILFTNYFQLEEKNFEYANNMISEAPVEKVIWDHNRYYNPYSNTKGSGNTGNDYNPLGYLLSFKEFKWAWYILLSMGFVLILFNLKRRQRIMPIHVRNENTSLAFVETVGMLFFQNKANIAIARKDLDLFLYHVRKKYGVNITEMDEHAAAQLAQKAQVELGLTRSIIDKSKAIQYLETMSDDSLINYHQLIEEFHKKAR